MIFDEITLSNFGVFRGDQSLRLTPTSERKPIVLIGGLNGGGKTTILDALMLVLYGKLARCSNRGSMGYEEYLSRCIHRSVDPSDGSSIELQFRHTIDGSERSYRIARRWHRNGIGIKETVEVFRDGVIDEVLTQSWAEHIDLLLPNRISGLFFFDGEKIEQLAGIEYSRRIVETGIQSLLGLDLVERLSTDLMVLEGRKASHLQSDTERQKVAIIRTELEKLDELWQDLVSEKTKAERQLNYNTERYERVDERFRSEGGELYSRRREIEVERNLVRERLSEVQERLRELAAGPAPLLRVQELLSAVEQQDSEEQEAIEADLLFQIVDQRDTHVASLIQEQEGTEGILQAVEHFFAEDRRRRAEKGAIRRYLHLDGETREQVRALRLSILKEAEREIDRSTQLSSELTSELNDIDRLLSRIPDEDAIADIVRERDEIDAKVAESRGAFRTIQLEVETIQKQRAQKQQELSRVIERAVGKDFDEEDNRRILSQSRRVRGALKAFEEATVKAHAARIQQTILESFASLLRKESLITDLTIVPETQHLSLSGPDGREITPDRLSAGERQLLAVSILWGLARASGRPLPTVIDTPLGRLDASHRMHLVERYFPYASHQVILLSTDEEINESYHKLLRPWIGRSYLLSFSDEDDATTIESGYFW